MLFRGVHIYSITYTPVCLNCTCNQQSAVLCSHMRKTELQEACHGSLPLEAGESGNNSFKYATLREYVHWEMSVLRDVSCPCGL